MTNNWIPQLMDQMAAEREELVARVALLDGARDALAKVYPRVVMLAGPPEIEQTREAAVADDEPEPAPEPAEVNNRKPRAKPGNGRAAKGRTPAPAAPATDHAVAAAVSDASLSAYDRATLTVLRANNGLTISEVADKMGLSYGGAYSRLQHLKASGLAVAGADKFWRA